MSKGHITLSKYSSNFEDDHPIHLKIEDADSSAQFIDIRMTLENFALLLTNMGYIDCQFELRALDVVGKKREHKKESVSLPPGMFLPTKEQAKELIKPFEVDGWIGSIDDATNHHNRSRVSDNVLVSFVRFI